MHPYCVYVASITDPDDVDKLYHDHHYGVRIEDEDELFGRLIMEINQAGLSWRTILMKEQGFRKVYNNFSIKKVASYQDRDVARLLNDSSIIRNRLKVKAAIYNARAILSIQKEYGSFRIWLDRRSQELKEDKSAWVKEFKKHFKFVGGEIVGEFLMSIDLISGAHGAECTRFKNSKLKIRNSSK